MRRITFALASLTLLACRAPAPQPEAEAEAEAKPEPSQAAAASEREPTARRKLRKPIVREDLVATDLPPIPTLPLRTAEIAATGEFAFPDASDELRPRAAVRIRDGLVLVGQAYAGRELGQPAKSWRWSGLVANAGPARAELGQPGAILAAVATEDGGGLLVGTDGLDLDAQGWFAVLAPDGRVTSQAAIASPGRAELFDLIAGEQDREAALLVGYVDAQAWLLAVDQAGVPTWTRTLGGDGFTQARALARLDQGGVMAVGSLAQRGVGVAWSATLTPEALGAEAPDADALAGARVEIAGADPHQLVHAIVDVGEAGYIALGTAKRNLFQAHEQVFAIGFDRRGVVAWTRVVPELRATTVLGARADAGAAEAEFIVALPLDDELEPETALGLVLVPADPARALVSARLADSDGWSSAGFIEGAEGSAVLGFHPISTGIEWRELALAAP